MRPFRRSFAARLLLALAAVVPVGPMAAADKTQAVVDRAADPTASVPVNLVVFTDFACPYSAQLDRSLLLLQRRYGAGLHVVTRNLPLPIHPGAALAHRAALAAGLQGKYREMAALLYANEAHQERAELLTYAAELGLDRQRFERDLDSSELRAQVEADAAEADALGVHDTPVLFVNGQRLNGYQREAVIDAAIRKAAAPQVDPAQTPLAEQRLDAKLTAELGRSASGTALGSPAAPVTLVEFTDFQCPFCRKAVEPVKQLLAARGQQVRWVYRAYPLDFHEHAQLAAEAAFAAGAQGKFQPMYDLLFEHQDAQTPDDLRRYALQLGLDIAAFDEALRLHTYAGKVALDRALGERAGVDGTPAFFLDGEPTAGVRSVTELVAWVDAHAAATGTVVAAVQPPPDTRQLVVQEASASAPVTVTWFTDVRSALAERQATVVQALLAAGQARVRLLVRPLPVPNRADGALSSAALVAALRQNAFWPMYRAIAARRDTLDRDKVLAVASTLKLDEQAFTAAMDASDDDLSAARDEAVRRGVLGTPVVFVGTHRVDGLQAMSSYEDALRQEMGTGLQASR